MSSAASDVYKRQGNGWEEEGIKKKERRKEFRGKGGKGGKKKKKSSAGFKPVRLVLLVGQVSSAGRPVCGTGGGGWKDWFHLSPFLGHTLRCCSACRSVPHGPCAPH